MTTSLDAALGAMRDSPRWFLFRLTMNAETRKYDKRPCPLDGASRNIDASKTDNWNTYAAACDALAALGAGYALGYWLCADSGYFFFDLDYVFIDDKLTENASGMLNAFHGCLTEWSSSGKGLHIIGRAKVPPHATRPPQDVRDAGCNYELYSNGRGICFGTTGIASGSADKDATPTIELLVGSYFPPRSVAASCEITGPVGLTDEELIQRALDAKPSAAVAFGAKASFSKLWHGEVEKNSEADAALASHLAFWTARDVERIERLMWASGMVRDKWRTHRTYLELTIRSACERVEQVYQDSPRHELEAASPCSELSNAHRIKQLHGPDLMAVANVGWFVWEGLGPWKCDTAAANRRAFGLGKVIQAEAEAMDAWVNQDGIHGTEEQEQRLELQRQRMKWARASESKAVIDHSLAMASSLLGERADKLDASPRLVGCPSGVIDLTAISMREHRREDRITKTISCDYDSAARAPRWERFISDSMGDDAELINYLQTLCGYILSGVRGEHLLPILYGTGANGKSTFLTTLQTLLGDYACVAAPGLLITRGGTEHPTGLASLQGRRLAIVSETGEAGRLNEEQVKLLTGGDRISARRMRQDFYEFDATHVIVLQTNHKPRVVGNDEGIWRRMKLIPFTQTVPNTRRDPSLPGKLAAELPGILAWVVEGWRKYQEHGFVEPMAVRAATAEYRSDSDHVGAFLAERCLMSPERTASAADVYTAYKLWCEQAGERPLSQRTLGLRLAERPGIAQGRTTNARMWRGVAVDHASYFRLAPSGP